MYGTFVEIFMWGANKGEINRACETFVTTKSTTKESVVAEFTRCAVFENNRKFTGNINNT